MPKEAKTVESTDPQIQVVHDGAIRMRIAEILDYANAILLERTRQDKLRNMLLAEEAKNNGAIDDEKYEEYMNVIENGPRPAEEAKPKEEAEDDEEAA